MLCSSVPIGSGAYHSPRLPTSQAVSAGIVLAARKVFPYIITSDREVAELASSVSVPFAAAIFFFSLMVGLTQVRGLTAIGLSVWL